MVSWPQLARAALFAGAYLAFAEAGHFLSLRPSAFATFWPPSGLYLAVLLSTERRSWPSLFIGALAANLASDLLLHDKSVPVSLAFALGNALEAFAGASLVQRFAGPRFRLDRMYDVLALAVLSALLSTTLSATVGTTTVWIALGGTSWPTTWFVWWSADAVGVLIFAPALLALADARLLRSLAASPWRLAEFTLVLLALAGLTVYVFGQPPSSLATRPVALLPLLLWIAVRFGTQGIALGGLIPCLVITWYTVQGVGPFAPPGANPAHQVIALQVALSVLILSTLLLAALVAERREATVALQESEEHLRRANRELEQLRETLLHQSLVDPLTGLANRRAIDKKLAEEMAQSRRLLRPFSVVVIDVDHFKGLNDSLGHAAGDRCLQDLARTFSGITRPADLVGRLGGEEFIVILPATDGGGALMFGSRLLKSVADLRLPNPASDIAPHVTISVGVATYQGEPSATPNDLVGSADRALYRAKQQGRNRVEVGSLAAR
jgi:diguanylate cyclase (GGDEF)-like protein